MMQKAPGRSHRKGMTVMQFMQIFPDDVAVEAWFEEQRCSVGERHYPDCGSTNYANVACRKPIVADVKEREGRQVSTAIVERADAATMYKFVTDRTESTTTIYTDESTAYSGLPRHCESMSHSAGEYVRGEATVNGMEAFWSLLKRSFHSTFRHLSDKHLPRYVAEFEGRNNIRDMGTLAQIEFLAARLSVSDCATRIWSHKQGHAARY